MTPTEKIAEMIDELPPDDKEKAIEYIELLHSKRYVIPESLTEEDKEYRAYVLRGIEEGEAAIARGEVYDDKESWKRLNEMIGE